MSERTERDWLLIRSQAPMAQVGRVLTVTPYQVAVEVTHEWLRYGTILEEGDPYVFKQLKRAIYLAVRSALVERSSALGAQS